MISKSELKEVISRIYTDNNFRNGPTSAVINLTNGNNIHITITQKADRIYVKTKLRTYCFNADEFESRTKLPSGPN